MLYLNKVMLIGNLTQDPDLKALPSGSKVVNFSIATNHSYKDQAGQKQEKVEYHNIIAFGRTAEVIAQYFKKGAQIMIEGKLQTRNWEDKETGKKVYKTEVLVENFGFGNSNRDTSSRDQADDQGDNIEYGSDEINADDVPF